ncbi:MAG: sugar nucleotide-binding protein [Anaerolineae bacterium]|nr:sugar nucleotide-binding protein [Anaerolineae bacterium]
MTERYRLLVTGGSGYLGRALSVKAAPNFEVYPTYQANADGVIAGEPVQLDITDRPAVLKLVDALNPQAIIHTAASNPGQHDEQRMIAINAEGAKYVAEAAAAAGIKLVHVSSDAIHDGKQAPFADDVPPTPLNAYGRSKAMAEANVLAIDPQAVIARTSLIYGLHEMDRGTEGFVERLERGETLVLFSDVLRQPIWTETLSEALIKLAMIDFAGFVNVAGRQAITREEFGRKMLAYWGIKAKGRIRSGRAADISDKIPRDVRLSVSKGEQLLQMRFPGVDEVLAMPQPRPEPN